MIVRRKKSKVALSKQKQREYAKLAKMVRFFRRNPVIACEELLGIKLMDSQKWILTQSWNRPYNIWTCSRNFGKSFLVDVFIMLKKMLYPNTQIYLLSNSGSQAIETFLKLEDIAKQNIDSIPSLKDIYYNEVVKSRKSDGFVHDKQSHRVRLLNNSTLYTLNSVPDNIRGKRANLLVFDESAFCTDELIDVALPFLSQESSFKLSTDEDFDVRLLKEEIPNQVIFASSASDLSSRHAKEYREYAKRMLMGDQRYFACDIPVDVAIKPLVDGEPTNPLITKEKVQKEMRLNPEKAMREYYNKFQIDGVANQIIKWADIRRNETFSFPQLDSSNSQEKFLIAFDPAHGSNDNSIIGVMKVLYDEKRGYYGQIVNVVNLLDTKKSTKRNMKFTDQTKLLRQLLVDYSTGDKSYYQGIEKVFIDAGAGGHGTSYADELLEDWEDSQGFVRRGIIDKTHPKYKEEARLYSGAKDILRLTEPRHKNEFIANTIIMIKSDLVEFNKEYNGDGKIPIEVENGNEVELQYKTLSPEQQVSLVNMDLMKVEATSMEEHGNKYRISKSKEHMVGDDRFDVLAMLCNGLHEIRRNHQMKSKKKEHSYADFFIVT